MEIVICDDNRFFIDELSRKIIDYFAKVDKACTIQPGLLHSFSRPICIVC